MVIPTHTEAPLNQRMDMVPGSDESKALLRNAARILEILEPFRATPKKNNPAFSGVKAANIKLLNTLEYIDGMDDNPYNTYIDGTYDQMKAVAALKDLVKQHGRVCLRDINNPFHDEVIHQAARLVPPHLAIHVAASIVYDAAIDRSPILTQYITRNLYVVHGRPQTIKFAKELIGWQIENELRLVRENEEMRDEEAVNNHIEKAETLGKVEAEITKLLPS